MTRSCVSDEQFRQLHRRTDELMRRTNEGTLSFKPTMDALQAVIEGKHEPAKRSLKPLWRLCGAWNGNHCTVCNAFFGDGDVICANGHEIGVTYAA